MKTCVFILTCLCYITQAAVPTFESFEPLQFDTNSLMLKYRSDWTNEVGVLRPATINTEITVTNLNVYETLVLPAKVFPLILGTNELNVSTNSTWLLSSPTNDAAQVVLSLSSGRFQGQLLLITSQNDAGGFTLPDGSDQYDSPGAVVDLQGNWQGTTNRGILLQYTAPDWIEMARFDPSVPAPEGFTTGAGVTNIANVVSGNYSPGSNISLTTNANGNITIAASGGGSGSVTNVSSGNITNLLTISIANPTTTPAFTFTRVDPGANRIVIFDDTDDQFVQGVIGAGLSYDAPSDTLSATGQPAFTTGVGVTNISNVVSGNYSQGNNMVFTTNANGNVTAALNNDITIASGLVTNNIGALLSVGSTDYVDLLKASQTNSVSTTLTLLYATNGTDLVDRTHVRWIFNGSGADRTLVIPSGWRTNVYSAVPPALTNDTITRMVVACGGPTSSAALQTNVYVSFEYFK